MLRLHLWAEREGGLRYLCQSPRVEQGLSRPPFLPTGTRSDIDYTTFALPVLPKHHITASLFRGTHPGRACSMFATSFLYGRAWSWLVGVFRGQFTSMSPPLCLMNPHLSCLFSPALMCWCTWGARLSGIATGGSGFHDGLVVSSNSSYACLFGPPLALSSR